MCHRIKYSTTTKYSIKYYFFPNSIMINWHIWIIPLGKGIVAHLFHLKNIDPPPSTDITMLLSWDPSKFELKVLRSQKELHIDEKPNQIHSNKNTEILGNILTLLKVLFTKIFEYHWHTGNLKWHFRSDVRQTESENKLRLRRAEANQN